MSIVLDSGFNAVDSGFQVLDSRLFVSGTWIPDSKRFWDPDSLTCISDSKAQVCHSTRKITRNADSLTVGEK